MHVASLELCRTLHELSGWGNPDAERPLNEDPYFWTDGWWCQEADGREWEFYSEVSDHTMWGNNHLVPAYDLGYLLRKLPPKHLKLELDIYDRWKASFMDEHIHRFEIADTPEDAACKLAIALFKQGILTNQKGA